MAHDVFVCYSSEDKTIANAACAKLESAGIRCWMAPRDPIAGIPYGRQLVDAITAARVVLLIFSGNANRSEHVLRELEVASDSGKIIVPFRIENVTPSGDLRYYITRVHWLDAMSPPMESRLNELVTLMQRLLEMPLTPAPQPVAVAAARRISPVLAGAIVLLMIAVAGAAVFALRGARSKAPAVAAAATSHPMRAVAKATQRIHSSSLPGMAASAPPLPIASAPPVALAAAATPRIVYVTPQPAKVTHAPAPAHVSRARVSPVRPPPPHVAMAAVRTAPPAPPATPQQRAPTLVTCQLAPGQTLTFRQEQPGSWSITNSAVRRPPIPMTAQTSQIIGGVMGTMLTSSGRFNSVFIPNLGSSNEILRFGRTRDDPTVRWVHDCDIATES